MAKSEENIPDDAEIKRFWAETMRDCSEKMSIRMAASNNLAKARGMYRDEWQEGEKYEIRKYKYQRRKYQEAAHLQ